MSSSPTAHLGSGVNHPGIPRDTYFSAYRSEIASRLRRHAPKAFLLLHLLCERARYTESGFNPYRLAIGQCVTGRGDHKDCGLSPKEYWIALRVLKTWQIIDTVVRKGFGTIVTIIDRRIFDPLSAIEIAQTRGRDKEYLGTTKWNEKGQPKGQLKGQPFTEGKSQPNGQPNGTNRDNQTERKGTLTTIYKYNDNDDRNAEEPSKPPEAGSLSQPESSSIISGTEEKEDWRDDPLYPEFKRYCKSKGGNPHPKGFKTWKAQQVTPKPKPRKPANQTSQAKEPEKPDESQWSPEAIEARRRAVRELQAQLASKMKAPTQ
jgi:hypothetical protein